MNQNPIVYLAGPIAGLQYADATGWRTTAALALRERSVETLSPMRAKAQMSHARVSHDFRDYEQHGAMFTAAGIMVRDHSDVRRCNALLVNLLGASPSFGTAMEIAWAYDMHKPVVVAIEDGNVHLKHPMLASAMDFRCATLDDAIDTVAVVLGR